MCVCCVCVFVACDFFHCIIFVFWYYVITIIIISINQYYYDYSYIYIPGAYIVKTVLIRYMRSMKRQALRILQGFIEKSHHSDQDVII